MTGFSEVETQTNELSPIIQKHFLGTTQIAAAQSQSSARKWMPH